MRKIFTQIASSVRNRRICRCQLCPRAKDLEKYPLQLIILTQDDIIAQKAYQGLTHRTYTEEFKPKFLKVYNCKDAVQDDFVSEMFNSQEISYFDITDKIIG